jgi:hypothetical protein
VDRQTVDRLGSRWIEKKRKASDSTQTVTAHDGTAFEVQPHDPNDNRTVCMVAPGIEMTAVPAGRTPVPWVSVEFGAVWCWNHSLDELASWARNACQSFGMRFSRTLVTRMDACVDVDERFTRSDVRRFEGQHRGNLTGTVAFSDGTNGFTGLRYQRTKDRDLTFRVYDKCAEVDTRDGHTFWNEVWDAHDVDEDSPVWRVEFEARRGRLRERGIDSWKSLTSNTLEQFWSYCTEDFARMDRQLWDRIQDASTQDASEREEVDPVFDPEQLTKQAAGSMERIKEELGVDTDAVMAAVRKEMERRD